MTTTKTKWTGTTGDDTYTVKGQSGEHELVGGLGDDTLTGSAGADKLVGGTGHPDADEEAIKMDSSRGAATRARRSRTWRRCAVSWPLRRRGRCWTCRGRRSSWR